MKESFQFLSLDPKTKATAAARRAEPKQGEMAEAGEAGLGAGDSAAWPWAAPMRDRAVKRRAMRAINEALERAIAENISFLGFWRESESEI